MSAKSNSLAEKILAQAINYFIKISGKYPNPASRNLSESFLGMWTIRLQKKELSRQQKESYIEENAFENNIDTELDFEGPNGEARLIQVSQSLRGQPKRKRLKKIKHQIKLD